jgi:hypothetical protein
LYITKGYARVADLDVAGHPIFEPRGDVHLVLTLDMVVSTGALHTKYGCTRITLGVILEPELLQRFGFVIKHLGDRAVLVYLHLAGRARDLLPLLHRLIRWVARAGRGRPAKASGTTAKASGTTAEAGGTTAEASGTTANAAEADRGRGRGRNDTPAKASGTPAKAAEPDRGRGRGRTKC